MNQDLAIQQNQLPNCQIHNLQAVRIEYDEIESKRFQCILCFSKKNNIPLIDEQMQQQNRNLKKIENYKNKMSIILDNYKQELIKQKDFYEKTFLKMIQILDDYNIQTKNNFNQLILEIQKFNPVNLQTEQQKLLEQNNKLEESIIPIITNLKNNFSVGFFNKFQYELNVSSYFDESESEEEIIVDDKRKFNPKNIFYKLQPTYSVPQNNFCGAIAINNENTTIAAGKSNKIIIYQITKTQLQQTAELSFHKDDISCLLFTKDSKNLLSGSFDKQIVIWLEQQKNEWIQLQCLNQHQLQINCLLLNSKEDQLMSCSKDKTIKFWNYQNSQWNFSNEVYCNGMVFNMSLNSAQNKLIACTKEFIIIINKKEQNWVPYNKLNTENYGYRICFLDTKAFAFMPLKSSSLELYSISKQDFQKEKIIKIQSGEDLPRFNLQFIQSKGILVAKSGKYINILRMIDQEFKLEQTIELGGRDINGCVSADGTMIVAWEKTTEKLQIWKLKVNKEDK